MSIAPEIIIQQGIRDEARAGSTRRPHPKTRRGSLTFRPHNPTIDLGQLMELIGGFFTHEEEFDLLSYLASQVSARDRTTYVTNGHSPNGEAQRRTPYRGVRTPKKEPPVVQRTKTGAIPLTEPTRQSDDQSPRTLLSAGFCSAYWKYGISTMAAAVEMTVKMNSELKKAGFTGVGEDWVQDARLAELIDQNIMPLTPEPLRAYPVIETIDSPAANTQIKSLSPFNAYQESLKVKVAGMRACLMEYDRAPEAWKTAFESGISQP